MGWKKVLAPLIKASYRDEHPLSKTEKQQNRRCSVHVIVKFGGFASAGKTEVENQEPKVKSQKPKAKSQESRVKSQEANVIAMSFSRSA